jgi:hypothetical protein
MLAPGLGWRPLLFKMQAGTPVLEGVTIGRGSLFADECSNVKGVCPTYLEFEE